MIRDCVYKTCAHVQSVIHSLFSFVHSFVVVGGVFFGTNSRGIFLLMLKV